MIPPGDKVLIAVSGGGDSVSLFSAMYELVRTGRLTATLAAAHLNHGLRAEDSDGDEEFCRGLTGRLGIEFVSERVSVKALAAERGIGVEEAARDARIEFLSRAAARIGAGRIALGHTMDDQAETVIFRAVRGTGLDGLAAMRPVQPWSEVAAGKAPGPVVIRPMLGLRRAELREYLRSTGQTWREDATNLDTAYSRNAVRLAMLPGMERINPKAVEALARLAELAGRASEHLRDEAVKALRDKLVDEPGAASAPVEALRTLDPAVMEFALRELARRATGSLEDLTYASVERMADLLEGGTGRAAELPGGAVAERSYERLVVRAAKAPEAEGWSASLKVPGEVEIPRVGRLSAALHERRPPAAAEGALREVVDFDAVGAPKTLAVRSRREGDRMSPMGLGGTKKVKDILIDAKVPARERDLVPVVESERGIIWLGGIRLDESAKVTPRTGRFLELRFRPSRGS